MAIKTARFKIKGMNQDLAVSSFSPEFAYENFNLRITATDNNTLLSLTNEKGNKEILSNAGSPKGFTLGYAVIGDNVILFTHEDIQPTAQYPNIDHIYRIYNVSPTVYDIQELYSGILNFDMSHPIETLAWYENEDIQKIYWVDGLNKPRMINIIHNGTYSIVTSPETQFDFNRVLQLNEQIQIDSGDQGQFHSGVIQYFITYYNRNGSESNVAWQSPLFYISHKERGASPDEMVLKSFSLKFIHGTIDTNFEFLRLYSVLRTTKDGEVQVRRVADLDVNYVSNYYTTHYNTEFVFVDNGTIGEAIDSTYLFYVGGADIIAGCIAQKDQTLFLGDITLNGGRIPKMTGNVAFTNKNVSYSEAGATGKYYHFYNSFGYQGYSQNTAHLEGNQFISTFKYLETYRFGVQFQYNTGEWSNVIYIQDATNLRRPHYDSTNNIWIGSGGEIDVQVPNDPSIVKVRPVVVYPKSFERNVVCQGILCPTVFNVDDRVSNRIFSYSSWFSRPNAPMTMSYVYKDNEMLYPHPQSVNGELQCYLDGSPYETSYPYNPYAIRTKGFYDKGCWAEFRHNYGIPSPNKFNGEIQLQYRDKGGMTNKPLLPYTWSTSPEEILTNPQAFNEKWNNGFSIDQSIFTLHSPDIEFDDNFQNLDLSGLKLRIVGYVPVSSNSGDIDIQAKSPSFYQFYKWSNQETHTGSSDWTVVKIIDTYNAKTKPNGFYKEKVGQTILSSASAGWFSLINGPYWQDKLYNPNVIMQGDTNRYNMTLWTNSGCSRFGFIVYPWQQSGSLSNDIDGQESTLQTKVISNLKYSINSIYFNRDTTNYPSAGFWTPSVDYNGSRSNGLTDIKYIGDEEGSYFTQLRSQFVNTQFITYSGRMNKVLTKNPQSDWGPKLCVFKAAASSAGPWSSLEPYYAVWDYVSSGIVWHYSPTEDYGPQHGSEGRRFTDYDYYHTFNDSSYFSSGYYYYAYPQGDMYAYGQVTDDEWQATLIKYYAQTDSPISMCYKSKPHVVMSLDSNTTKLRCLPSAYKMNGSTKVPINGRHYSFTSGHFYTEESFDDNKALFFDPHYNDSSKKVGILQSAVQQADLSNEQRGFYWLAELYRDNVANRFGGTTEEALANNVWYVAGPAVHVDGSDTSLGTNGVVVPFYEGDTFYQRYDHLKTYPYAQDDPNQLIEIVSFMCETRVNTGGRYDLMIGLENNNNISTEVFNSINRVYSQLDNYITGSYIKSTDLRTTKFPNTVIWSDQKLNGEYVDRWTQILTTNSLDLDGDKGRLRALKKYAGTLWGFQDRAIAEILFNPNVAISTTDGSPIELASSGKVEGKRYKFNNVGCSNKWSICETPVGLFFNDDINKNLMVLGESPQNLSDKMGMSTWAKKVLDSKWDWDDEEWNNMTVQYDRKNKDVLYITSEECLAYSTLLGTFTSFYSYENTPYFINVGNSTLGVKRYVQGGYDYTGLWQQNLGTYGSFFGERQPFYTTFIVNDNPTIDKVFNTLEYRADYFHIDGSYDESKTFSRLFTWNEYQNNGSSGTLVAPNVQKKFRIWRMELPRDENNPLDRMRNPWQYIKIQQDAAWGGKVEIHDFAVHYTE